MKSWMIGAMVGVLALGGAAVWMVSSGTEPEAARGTPSERVAEPAQELPSFDRPLGEARLAEPTALVPAAGGVGEVAREGAPASAQAEAAEPAGEDVRFVGRVVDGARRPIEGATVLFVADPMRLQMQAREDREALAKLPLAKTDRNGRFELTARVVPRDEDARPGFRFDGEAQQLVVRHDSFATLTQALTDVSGPTNEVGELMLDPGAWLSGRAIDSDGRPVAGAQARASNDGDRRDNPGGFLSFLGRGLVESLDSSITGADGRFMVRGLHPGAASLTAFKSGLRAAAREGLELEPMAGLDVGDVTLDKGVSIAGVVLDEKGAPLAAADVSVSSMTRLMLNRIEDLPRQQLRSELGQRTRTDENGHFELGGLAGGTYTVHVNADGFDPLSKPDVAAGRHDLRLEPVRLGGLLVRLTSTDGGKPVEGARLSASPKQNEGFNFTMRNLAAAKVLAGAEALAAAKKTGDPAGVYFVPHAGLEGTELVVAADGFATTALEAPGAPSGGVGEYAAQIPAESLVAGVVVDPQGKPIERARLTLRSDTGDDDGFEIHGGPGRRDVRRSIRIGDESPVSATRHSAVTGKDGRFELHGVAAGEWELEARARNYVRGEAQALTLEAGKSQSDLRLVLAPAGAIVGTVTETSGAPAAGIEVSLQPFTTAAPQDTGSDPVERQISRLGAMVSGDGGNDRRRTRTDMRGEYRIGDLAPGEYSVKLDDGPRGGVFGGGAVLISMDGNPPQAPGGTYAKVEAGKDTRIDFQRPERARLNGKVLAGGVPAAGMEVHLRQAGTPSFLGGGGRTATTDAHGLFSFEDVVAGKYDLAGLAPGAALEKTVPVELIAGQTRSADLIFGGSTLSGRVLEQGSDRPAANVNITVSPVVASEANQPRMAFEMVMVQAGGGGANGTSFTIGGGSADLVRTDAEGRFEVRYLEPGKYGIEAGGEGFIRTDPVQVELNDGQNKSDVVLHVTRGAVLTGVVRDTSGLKLDKVPVRLESAGDQQMTVTSNGSYRFEGLLPGDYSVSVLGSGFMSDPIASEEIKLESGQQATLDLKTKPSEG